MQLQSFSGGNIHIHTYIHNQLSTGSTSRSLSLFGTSSTCTLKQLSTGDLVNDDSHTYIHLYAYPRLITCTNTFSSFTLAEALIFHACSATRNLHTYFTSVRRVYIIDCRSADCTVRHLSAERPFSSLSGLSLANYTACYCAAD